MKLQSLDLNSAERPDVTRSKISYGLWYGIVVGLSFAVFCWGIDGYMLANSHGMQPWLKFITGGAICIILGGLTGWLSAKLGSPIYATLLWLVVSFIFAWLVVNVPLTILPKVVSITNPQAYSLLHYVQYDELSSQLIVAYIWIAIFLALTGLLQLPLSDSGVFSTSIFGKLAPMLVTVTLMGITGTIVDNGLVNGPLRSALLNTDSTIQFVVDNQGKKVEAALARKMRTVAFRTLEESVTQQRELIVSGYDALLGEINILVHFEDDWVECIVLYNQPSFCKLVEAPQ